MNVSSKVFSKREWLNKSFNSKTFFIICALWIAALLTGCMEANSTNDRTANSKPTKNGFTTDQKQFLPSKDSYVEKRFSNNPYKDFFGTLPNGLAYTWSINPSGRRTGTITKEDELEDLLPHAIWRFDCKPDQMDGGIDCIIRNTEAPNSILSDYMLDAALHLESRSTRTPHKICVAQHDFPGRNARIKVGNKSPISVGTDGCINSQQIALSALNGIPITVEGYHWPYDYSFVKTNDVRGAHYVMKLLKFTFEQDYNDF